MELNCPNCTTHFSVPDEAIGPKGRKLKCAKCGHTWRQLPAGGGSVPEPRKPAKKAAPPPPPEPEPEDAFDPAMDEGVDDLADDWGAAEDDQGDFEPPPQMPMEMAPTIGQPRRDPLDGYDSDIPMESDSGKRSASILDDDPLSGLDFGDSAFGSSDDDDDGFGGAQRNDNLDSQEIDDLLAAGPEPIADLFGRDEDDDDDVGSGSKGSLIAVVMILVMAALGAGAYFGRAFVVEMVPQLQPVYAAIGIEFDDIATGLAFQDVTSDRQSVNGVDVFVVRGFITNESERARTLPNLSLILFDHTDQQVQRVDSEPPQKTLEPGQTTGFRLKMENPSGSATRFDVFWSKPTEPAQGGSH